MYKILPIILVVVLSGCSGYPDEYVCKSSGMWDKYLTISGNSILWEDNNNSSNYLIETQTDTMITAKSKYKSKNGHDILIFHKKLLTAKNKRVKANGILHHYLYDCRPL